MPPLFRIDVGKKIMYAIDEAEKIKILSNLKQTERAKANVQRFKGLGEMNPAQLRETTLAPGKRRLLKLESKNYKKDARNARHASCKEKIFRPQNMARK